MNDIWKPDMSNEENLRSWVRTMDDGSELCVEQLIVPQTGALEWRALVRMGEDGDYVSVWSYRAASFATRSKAQQAAEDYYSAKFSTQKQENTLAALA